MRQRKRKEAIAASSEKSKDNDVARDAVVKRARSTQSKLAPLTPIQCISCKNTDVPLILGGSEFTCVPRRRYSLS